MVVRKCWDKADLLEIFKMVKGFTATPWSVFFHRAEDKITRGHSWKLVKYHCHCNTRLQFFSQRVINRWNSLTEEDISVSSVNCFKHRLEKRRNRQMDFFKHYKSYWLHDFTIKFGYREDATKIAICSRTRRVM